MLRRPVLEMPVLELSAHDGSCNGLQITSTIVPGRLSFLGGISDIANGLMVVKNDILKGAGNRCAFWGTLLKNSI